MEQPLNEKQTEILEKSGVVGSSANSLVPAIDRAVFKLDVVQVYKTYKQDLTRVADRRTTLNQVFITLNTGLTAGMIAVVKVLAIGPSTFLEATAKYNDILPALFAPPFLGFMLSVGWLMVSDHYLKEISDQDRRLSKFGAAINFTARANPADTVELIPETIDSTSQNQRLAPDADVIYYALPSFFVALHFTICMLLLITPMGKFPTLLGTLDCDWDDVFGTSLICTILGITLFSVFRQEVKKSKDTNTGNSEGTNTENSEGTNTKNPVETNSKKSKDTKSVKLPLDIASYQTKDYLRVILVALTLMALALLTRCIKVQDTDHHWVTDMLRSIKPAS